MTLQRNIVVDPKGTAVEVNNIGPLLLIDNIFVTKVAPVVKVRKDAGFFSIGNTFTVKDAVDANPQAVRLDEKFVPTLKVKPEIVEPKTLPLEWGNTIEVPAGAKGTDIQRVIDFASQSKKRAIIHLPAGVYPVDKPIVIPPKSDLRLVGDGGKTILRWVGTEGGAVLRVVGPTHLGLHDLMIDGARSADGIVVENCSQKFARVIADQINIAGARETGLLVETPKHVDVWLFNINHADCKVGVKVNGGRLIIFSGASSNNELSYEVAGNGELLVRDIWYETGVYPRFALFQDSGTFTMHAARVATPDKPLDVPVVELKDFRGRVSFIATNFTCAPQSQRPKVLVNGEGKATKLLLLGCGGDSDSDLLVNRSPHAVVSVLYAFKMLPGGAWTPVQQIGEAKVDPDFLRQMLTQTRQVMPKEISPLPETVTDLRFHRVLIFNTRNGLVLRR